MFIMKRATTLSLNQSTVDAAKKSLINMSEAAEKGILDAMNIETTKIDKSIENCEFCGRAGKHETARSARLQRQRPSDLTWLWPDEKWICNSCLKHFKSQIAASKA